MVVRIGGRDPSQDAARIERVLAIGMKLAAAIATAVAKDTPIDTHALLLEVERMSQSVGLSSAYEALAIAWAAEADNLADAMEAAARELYEAGVFAACYARPSQAST